MTPLNLAHRGARRDAPENTVPALTRAIELGADGVEIDVQRTRDDELILLHDETLEQTTDGTGFVRDHTLAELKALDAGSWFGEAWAGVRIPTLKEVFATLPATAVVNVELKRAALQGDGLEAAMLRFVRREDIWDRVIVSSFNPAIVWRLRHAAPRLQLALLYQPGMPFGLGRGWPRHFLPLAALHPEASLVTPRLVMQTHAAGLQVNTWTVNEPARMCELIHMGVDAIITDVPDVLTNVIARVTSE